MDLIGAVENLWNWMTGIGQTFTNTLGELGSWLFGGLQWLGDKFKEAWDNFTKWLYEGLKWIADRLKEGYEALAQWISGGLQWISSGLSWIGNQLYNFGQWIWNGILWVAHQVTSIVENFFNWLWSQLVNVWNTIVGFVTGWISSINDYLNLFIKSLRSKLKQFIIVNTTLPAIFKAYDTLVENPSIKGLIGVVAAPFTGAILAELVDAVIPKPQSERVIIFPELNIPTLSMTAIAIPRPPAPEMPSFEQAITNIITPTITGVVTGLIEKENSVRTEYEIIKATVATVEKECSVSTEYEVTAIAGISAEVESVIASELYVIPIAGIEVAKESSVSTEYECFLPQIIEKLLESLVKSEYEVSSLYGLEIIKQNSVSTEYEITGTAIATIEKENLVVTGYETTVETNYYSLGFYVYEGSPIKDATITVSYDTTTLTKLTDENGMATFDSIPFNKSVYAEISKTGFKTKSIYFTIPKITENIFSIKLKFADPISNIPISNATITAYSDGTQVFTGYTDNSGEVTITNLQRNKLITVVASKEGYNEYEISFRIV